MNLSSILKGVGREPEMLRTVGAFSLVIYVLTWCSIGWYLALWHPDRFDFTIFCAAGTGGFCAMFGSIAGSIALKDRNVAKAKIDDPTIPDAPVQH